jgi:hypothetical protein
MGDIRIIDLTPDTIADYGVCGYKDLKKHAELRRKIDWFARYYPKGLRIKVLLSEKGGYQGMIEYIPGTYAHRPVSAEGYMFIHCIFVGFRNEFKGKGYATSLIEACIGDARQAHLQGVAVVTRKGPFMAKKDIFVKTGFHVVDHADPDFELLALKFDPHAPDPEFLDMAERRKKYPDGLVILRSAQCPYSVKNVEEILHIARDTFGVRATLVDLEDSEPVQDSPCPFGTFCILYNGEVISDHPISSTRFVNIMKKLRR